MASKIGKFGSINWRELSIAYMYLIKAWWKLAIKKEKLDRWVVSGLEGFNIEASLDSKEMDLARQRSRWVNLAARFPVQWALCLQRSLALCVWLEQSDIKAQLRIGVRKQDDALEAHAWVEYCGQVLNDRPSVSRRFALMNVQQGVPSINQLSKVIRQ